MAKNQSQQYEIDAQRKTGKQVLIMHGEKVITAKELVKYIKEHFDENEDCCVLSRCITMNEETKERKVLQQVQLLKEMEF